MLIAGIHWSEVEFGSLGEWVAGIGALAAVVTAFVVQYIDRRHVQHDAKVTDLDETIRLLLMSRRAAETGVPLGPTLEGTLMNALAKHSQIMTVAEANDLMDQLRSPVWGGRGQALQQIDDAVTKLDGMKKALQ